MRYGVQSHWSTARHSLTVCQSDVRLSSKKMAIKLNINDFMFLVHFSVQSDVQCFNRWTAAPWERVLIIFDDYCRCGYTNTKNHFWNRRVLDDLSYLERAHGIVIDVLRSIEW